jgi:hypothetical protein
LKQTLLILTDLTDLSDGGQIRKHDGKRLFFTVLLRPQLLYRVFIARITQQLIPAQALECQDCPFPQQIRRTVEHSGRPFSGTGF